MYARARLLPTLGLSSLRRPQGLHEMRRSTEGSAARGKTGCLQRGGSGSRASGVAHFSSSSSSSHSQQCGLGGMIGGRVRGPWCQIHVVEGRDRLGWNCICRCCICICCVLLYCFPLRCILLYRRGYLSRLFVNEKKIKTYCTSFLHILSTSRFHRATTLTSSPPPPAPPSPHPHTPQTSCSPPPNHTCYR